MGSAPGDASCGGLGGGDGGGGPSVSSGPTSVALSSPSSAGSCSSASPSPSSAGSCSSAPPSASSAGSCSSAAMVAQPVGSSSAGCDGAACVGSNSICMPSPSPSSTRATKAAHSSLQIFLRVLSSPSGRPRASTSLLTDLMETSCTVSSVTAKRTRRTATRRAYVSSLSAASRAHRWSISSCKTRRTSTSGASLSPRRMKAPSRTPPS